MSQNLWRRVGSMVGAAAITLGVAAAAPGAAQALSPSLGSLKTTQSGLHNGVAGTVADPIEVHASAACPANTGTLILKIYGGPFAHLVAGYGILTGSDSVDAATGMGAHLPIVPTDRSLIDIANDNSIHWVAGKYTLILDCVDKDSFAETGTFTGSITFLDATHWTTLAVKQYVKARLAPVLGGAFRVGHRVSVTAGRWNVVVHISYQWLRDGKAIRRATRSTYLIPRTDRGHKLTCVVTASRVGFVSAKAAPRAKIVTA